MFTFRIRSPQIARINFKLFLLTVKNDKKMSIRPGLILSIMLVLVLGDLGDVFCQPAEIGLSSNPVLRTLTERSNQRMSQSHKYRLFVPAGQETVFCPDTLLWDGPLASLVLTNCGPIQFGEAIVSGFCLEYSSDRAASGIDRLCLEGCDTNGNCIILELEIEVRKSVSLPFIDVFSNAGPYPDQEKWLDSKVFINNSMADRPLSIGVATFDGLDENGRPYSDNPIYSDALTSTFIDLRSKNDVFLSFFIQPKGLGVKPRTEDSLVLDFKNQDGIWKRIAQFEGLPRSVATRDPAPDFAYKMYPVMDEFLHADFQFRFRNKSKNEGLQELWHLDYVRLTEGIIPGVEFDDISFVTPPRHLLDPYSAMPWTHFSGFESEELRLDLEIGLYNHFGVLETANPSFLFLNEITTNKKLIDNLTLLEVPPVVPQNQRNLSPGPHFFINPLDPVRYIQGLKELDPPGGRLEFEMIYLFNQDRENNNGIPEFISNNRASRRTIFSDFFAYDDGTAESAIIADNGETGRTQVAVEFHSNVSDSLQGIQISLPHIEGDASTLRFNLMVWIEELDEEPEFILNNVQPLYTDIFYDTLQGFTTYDLRLPETDERTAIFIPAGNFYIGWEQINTGSDIKIPVGFDKNTPEANRYIYFNVGDGWINVGSTSSTLQGALMIRPVVGNVPVIPTNVSSSNLGPIKIFPNPADQLISVVLPDGINEQWKMLLYALNGELKMAMTPRENIDVTQLISGHYVLVLINNQNGRHYLTKIQVVR